MTMSTTVTVAVLLTSSALGFTVGSVIPPPQGGDLIPWKDLTNGGSALLMLVSFVVFLRFWQTERTSRDAERTADRQHVEKVVGECTSVATKMVDAVREESSANRRDLSDLIREMRASP